MADGQDLLDPEHWTCAGLCRQAPRGGGHSKGNSVFTNRMLLARLFQFARRIWHVFGGWYPQRSFDAQLRRSLELTKREETLRATKWRIWAKLYARAHPK